MSHIINKSRSIFLICFLSTFSLFADLELNLSVHGINHSYENTVSGTTLGTLTANEDSMGFLASIDYGPRYGSFIGVSTMLISLDSVNFNIPGLSNSSNPIDATIFGLYPGIGYRFPLISSLDMNLYAGLAFNYVEAKMNYLGSKILDDSGWGMSFHWKIAKHANIVKINLFYFFVFF